MSSQTLEILDALKQELRKEGLTYKALGKALDMSEANIKRMFSQHKINLERLEKICDLLHLDILQLAQSAHQQRKQISQLTLEQENQLISDQRLLLVAQLCLSDWTFDEMLERYSFTEPQLIKYLIQLDRIAFIELLPGNRIRKRVSPHFKWHPKGPVQNFFAEHIQNEFFRSSFTEKNEKVLFISGMLSDKSNQKIQELIDELGIAYRQQLREDKNVGLAEKKGTSLVVGLRNWELSVFNDLRRKPL